MFDFTSPQLSRRESGNVVAGRTVRRLNSTCTFPVNGMTGPPTRTTAVQTLCKLPRPTSYHVSVMSEIGSTLFQVIAIVVLCALVWSLPARSREERRQRTAGVRTPHW